MASPEEPHSGRGGLEDAFYDTAPEKDARAVEGALGGLWRRTRVAAPYVGGVAGVLAVVVFAVAGPLPPSHADTPDLLAAARTQGAALARELGGAAPGPLRASLGTQSITPNPPNHHRLGGYTGVRKSVGLDNTLRAFAWVMQAGSGPKCAVTGADLLMVTPELALQTATEVAALAPIPRDRIVFTASHSHSSVGNYGTTLAESLAVGATETGVMFLSMRWAPTIWGAAHDPRPAVMRVAQPKAPLLLRNRLSDRGEVDPTVDVLQLDVDGDEPAVLVLFGAHPTSEARRDWMSPDYPGFMRDEVSSHVGAFVNFAGGALGSMGVESPTGERTPKVIGRLLATPVMNAVRPRPKTEDVFSAEQRLSCGRAPLPLPGLRVPVGGWALTERASAAVLDSPAQVHVSALLAGPAVMLSFPGELSGEVTLPLRQRARARGYALSIASFSGEYAGYFLPADRWGTGVEGPLQLAGVGAAAVAVAFAEAFLEALPQGPLPVDAQADRVWPR